jgi:hypothetical protein
MSCIAISPVIAICLLVQFLALHQVVGAFGGGIWAGSEAIDYAKNAINGIHSEIRKREPRSIIFIAAYPLVGLFLWVIAYPKQATIANIAVVSVTLWAKNATCT